jgi:sec-independent protein translocase protein TatC
VSIISKFKRYRQSQKKKAEEQEAAKSNGKANGQASEQETGEEKEMGFLDHVEELRWHLVRSFIAIGIVGIAIGINTKWVMDNIMHAPFSKDFWLNTVICNFTGTFCGDINVQMIAFAPFEKFFLMIKMAFVGGFIVAFPYVIWEIWRFVKPGLHQNEQLRFRGGVFVLSFLFFLGVIFAYYIILPLSFRFLADLDIGAGIQNNWGIGKTMGTVLQIPLAGGIMFELPVFVYVFSKLGLLTPEVMRQYRKHAIVVLLIISAVLTPPDIFSQVLIFLPLFLLYQISIGISARVNRKLEAELRGDVAE